VLLTEHAGATEAYAQELAEMRAGMAELDGWVGEHVDGDLCSFDAAVVWRCRLCGREQRQELQI
jgi:hypothetical protein